MQCSGIGFRVEFHERAPSLRSDIVRHDHQDAIQERSLFSIAPAPLITDRSFLQCEKIARVELNRSLEVSCGFCPPSLASLNVTRQLEYPWIIGQALARDLQLSESAVVIEIPLVEIPCSREMRFPLVGSETSRRLDGRFR